MDDHIFELTLANHCAPALLGLKASCLVSLSAADYPRLERLAGQYNATLEGARFLVLGHCKERTLLLVYRPDLMEQALAHPLSQQILAEAGYPVDSPLPWLLRRLMDRLEGNGEFPHEIGVFLGYPPEDVYGFMNDADGTGCKLCGVWKVYHDVEAARRRFRQYDACRAWLRQKLEQGQSLRDILGKRAA